jgi:alkylation response protein AidB-like acyl-CoA dehydrogenase
MRLSDEHRLYQEEVRSFVTKYVEPLSNEYGFDQAFTCEDLERMREVFAAHEIATTTPTREDGSVDLVAIGIFTEEISKIDCSLGALTSILFFNVLPMSQVLSDRQRQTYGHLFAPGKLVAMGLSEPSVGSDPSGLQTVARRVGNGWRIQGQKLWTTNATLSDAIIVACRVPEEDDAIGTFLVDRAAHEYTIRPIPCLGMRRLSTCEVFFDDCWVPDLARIGGTGTGLGHMLSFTNRSRLNLAFTSVGIAQAALDLAISYAKQREQFGRPIAGFQLVQELIVEMATDVAAGRLLAYNAAALEQDRLPARVEISMAKAFCTEMAVRVTSKSIQVHGGMGLTQEYPVERLFRDARMQTIPDGTTQIQTLIIGRELLGISALR